ncbi:MAG: response regulator transcription factor [bacterium]
MKILVVEDEPKLALSIQKGLMQEGYVVDVLGDGLHALHRIKENSHGYDLVILDLMLPNKDGLAVCREVRAARIFIPLLMLTARDTKSDVVVGLDAGADDYLIKPFSFEELLARIRSLARRPIQFESEQLESRGLVMNTKTRVVLQNGEEIALTFKEFALLEFLMKHRGQVVTREELLEHVWDFAFDSFSNVVDVHIKNLRKKINTHEEILETVRGVGYRLLA